MFLDFLYVTSVFFSIVTALVIWFRINKVHNFSAHLIATYLFLNAICFGFYFVILYGAINYFPVLYKMPAPISYLIPPISYIYVRSVLYNENRFRKRDLLHLIPFLFFVANYFSFYTMDLEEKRIIVSRVAENIENVYTVRDGLLPEWVNIMARASQSLIYLFFQWWLLIGFFKRNKENVSKQYRLVKKWLFDFTKLQTLYLISLVCLYVVIFFMVIASVSAEDFMVQFTRVILAVSYLLISGYLLWNPNILIGLPTLLITDANSPTEPQELLLLNIFTDFNTQVQQQKLFLDSSITLSLLAMKTDTSARRISEMISASNYANFNDYINHLRVAHSEKLIQKKYLEKHSIEALGKVCGFHSKNAFYRAFRKEYDCTPKEYSARKSLQGL
ncbi:helix-turn-helix transcriptional regulator [Maribacter aestuarii]|uniref:helix-turn-helix transcriptional regulator n=1 Tax=Maribacter aestuarii TaxID=1130723 RepID=UPI0025A5AC0F|nr:AraC family transcriptional regulator [Maribacter aestuarii]